MGTTSPPMLKHGASTACGGNARGTGVVSPCRRNALHLSCKIRWHIFVGFHGKRPVCPSIKAPATDRLVVLMPIPRSDRQECRTLTDRNVCPPVANVCPPVAVTINRCFCRQLALFPFLDD
jgi:hypothetical protein